MVIILCLTAFGASLVTLFSGFGLGTILLPVFALFFPLPVAIAATAVVHLFNNLFKAFIVGKHADKRAVVQFAIPASAAAVGGALLLKSLEGPEAIVNYTIGDTSFEIIAINFLIGALIVVFALMELLPQTRKLSFPPQYLPIGGILSGFFGGLSGLQGALRSAFLIQAGLSRDQYIATSVVSAILVDASRLLVYGLAFYTTRFDLITGDMQWLIVAATLSAFAGAFAGKRLLKKVSIDSVQKIVGVMLVIIGTGLALGVIKI
ncbi:MAG: sulfite exporter TauE/SafE family protein [Chitinispirillaceae bacterium]|nr:sulfite exporter TauE/SafE family protein [Chitinispirillaceae bacterium]